MIKGHQSRARPQTSLQERSQLSMLIFLPLTQKQTNQTNQLPLMSLGMYKQIKHHQQKQSKAMAIVDENNLIP